jgi:hypothetical protein
MKAPNKYEQAHYANMDATDKAIQKLFDAADIEMITFVRATFRDNPDYAKSLFFKAKLEDLEKKLHDSILNLIGKGVQNADIISAAKSKAYIQTLNPSAQAYQLIVAKEFKTTAGNAVQYFAKRAANGFDISARVWDITGQKKAEISDSVSAAIADGTSAKDMAKNIQQYLNNPDKVFRRVRDEEGKLVESQARKDFHPGQGIYKESEANAFRLSRTEINISYRSADNERWQQQEFVKAVDVKLSNSHPTPCDICDYLQGRYPKDFIFKGWHPSCLCYPIPVLLNKDEYSKYEDHLLGLGDKPEIKYESEIPVKASDYIQQHAERINGWSNSFPTLYLITRNM